jgi:hypothetical protein
LKGGGAAMDPEELFRGKPGYELTAERAEHFAVMNSWAPEVFLDLAIGVDPARHSQAEGTRYRLPFALEDKRSALSELLTDALNARAIEDSSPHSYIEWLDRLELERFRVPAILREAVERRYGKLQSQDERIQAIRAAYETTVGKARRAAAERVSVAQQAEREALDRAAKLQADKLALEQELARARDERPHPWGGHETEWLRTIMDAINHFWIPGAPGENSREDKVVMAWLEERGVKHRYAEDIARFIRDPQKLKKPKKSAKAPAK